MWGSFASGQVTMQIGPFPEKHSEWIQEKLLAMGARDLELSIIPVVDKAGLNEPKIRLCLFRCSVAKCEMKEQSHYWSGIKRLLLHLLEKQEVVNNKEQQKDVAMVDQYQVATREQYELLEMFKKDFEGHNLKMEDKEQWRRGYYFQDGRVNQLFQAYQRGYAYARALFKNRD